MLAMTKPIGRRHIVFLPIADKDIILVIGYYGGHGKALAHEVNTFTIIEGKLVFASLLLNPGKGDPHYLKG